MALDGGTSMLDCSTLNSAGKIMVRAIQLSTYLALCLPALVCMPPVLGQGKPGTSSPSSGQSGGNASGITGLSYSQTSWDSKLGFPIDIPAEKRVVLCFALKLANSGSTPFLLEPSPIEIPVYGKDGKVIPGAPGCRAVDYEHPYRNPIKVEQYLILAIDLSSVPRDRIRYLTINVTTQAGQTISTDSIRPSLTAGSTAQTNFGNQIFFLTWNQPLAGDVLPTFSLSATYTPVAQGLPWMPHTIYPAGSVIVPTQPNGHFYTTANGGISASKPPTFPVVLIGQTPEVGGSALLWADKGTAVPAGSSAWNPSTAYAANSIVIPTPPNGHYYQAATPGVSGLQAPAWPVGGGTVPEAASVIWLDSGATQPASAKVLKTWGPSTAYFLGDTILDAKTGHYFTVVSQGISGTGPNPPNFIVTGIPTSTDKVGQITEKADDQTVTDNEVTWKLLNLDTDKEAIKNHCSKVVEYKANTEYKFQDCIFIDGRFYLQENRAKGLSHVTSSDAPVFPLPFSMSVTWLDVGATAPASVASGQPSDQTISFNYTLTQSHSLYRFNLASGVVVSSIKNKSYVYTTPPTSTSPGVIKQLNSGPIVDPVLVLTAYVFGPIDAERPWRKKDLIPGASLGFSLSSPSNNFYFGGSSELFYRNLQIFYGFTIAKTATLAPPGTVQAATATTPPTYQRFSKGGFVGLTFNITGFIQSLFTSGGKGS
jgi:hypothetical protein